MRYLGLDLGSRTLGIATSDLTGTIATGKMVIRHNEEYDLLVAKVKELVETDKIGEIVLGLPKHMNNTIGEKALLSIEFEKMLKEAINIPVHLVDERLTTKMAENMLISNSIRREKRKKVIDSVAATIILQSYLDKL